MALGAGAGAGRAWSASGTGRRMMRPCGRGGASAGIDIARGAGGSNDHNLTACVGSGAWLTLHPGPLHCRVWCVSTPAAARKRRPCTRAPVCQPRACRATRAYRHRHDAARGEHTRRVRLRVWVFFSLVCNVPPGCATDLFWCGAPWWWWCWWRYRWYRWYRWQCASAQTERACGTNRLLDTCTTTTRLRYALMPTSTVSSRPR